MPSSPLHSLGPVLGPSEPEVRALAITTLNGRASIYGTSGGLGSAHDREVMRAVRSWADVIIVGANTVRAENYGAITATYPRRPAQLPHPRIATISRSLDFDPDTKFFRDALSPPIILCPTAQAHSTQARRLSNAGADIVALPSLSPAAITQWAQENAYYRVVLEGGPRVYQEWLTAGVVDVVHLSFAPVFVDKAEPLLFEVPSEVPMRLEHVACDEAGLIFARYRIQK